MKKLIILCIKLIPLITLYKGVTSGSVKFKPLVNAGKVAMTQYEVSQMTKMVADDYVENRGALIDPRDFGAFVQDNYYNQYSDLLRKALGWGSDYSIDLWKHPYQMYLDEGRGKVEIISSGPDGELDSRDDIKLGFKIK